MIRLFLKLTNRNHLIQFLDGLHAIGKPTDVLYPVELVEQAALLGLSGLNNTLAIQSNQHWIWPYWVERQLNPDSDEFIPTGVNLLTTNLSFRNWTSLSIAENRNEAMLDPVGMLTLEPFSWSVMPYLIKGDQYYIPSKMHQSEVQQSLHRKQWPEIFTHYKTNAQIQWFSKTKALAIDQQQVLQQKYFIKNLSNEPCTLTFGVSLRPYNSLTIGHIHKLSCKNNTWKVNGRSAMLMLKTPETVLTSNRLLGDPIYSHKHATNDTSRQKSTKKIKLKSRSGISTGIAEYQLTLEPNEQVSFQFLLTDKHNNILDNKKKNRSWNKEILQAERHFKQYWKKWSRTGINIGLPDKMIENAFYAVKNHLCVFDDVDQFTPGSFFYHSGWFRDSAFLALGFDQAGYFQQVKNKFPGYFKLQALKGHFKSQNGEWDSTGQAIFSIITHIRRSGDSQLLKKHYPALLKGAKWINKTRLTGIAKNIPHYGLLPAGLSAEHFGPNDHYYWDNFWSLTGIQQLIWSAKKLQKHSDVVWLQTIFDAYYQNLQTSIKTVTDRNDTQALACSPYRWMDTAAIGNLAAITPMNLILKDDYWVAPTLEFLWQNNVRNGLFFQHIIHSGENIYLSIQLAKLFLIRQDSRWKIIFNAVLDAASSTWTWPEAIHPKTGGGCMGDGDHGWAAAEFISLIRDMLVYEQQDSLFLGAGIFSEWFDLSTQNIELKNASTLHGTVSFSLNKKSDAIIFSWQIIRNQLQDKVPLYLLCQPLLENYTVDQNHTSNQDNTFIQLHNDSGEYRFKLLRQSS